MKHILLIFCLSISCSLFAQKKIKNSVVLSTNDTVSVNDAIILKKGSSQDAAFSFVRTRSDYSVSSQYSNTQQEILYFKEIDNICYAYTFSFIIDLEKALKNGEIVIGRVAGKTAAIPVTKSLKIDPEKVLQPESIHSSEINELDVPIIKTQEDSMPDEMQYFYCQIVGTQKMLSSKVTITIDFGQVRKFVSDQRLRNNKGEVVVFNSMVDAMNWMGARGWEFVQAYVLTVSNQNVYHWLLKKSTKKMSEETGVHVIATTGFNKHIYYPNWVEEKSTEEISDILADDILEGRDGIRAGFIKIGTYYNMIHPLEEKTAVAAAQAQKRCGAPIWGHTEAGTMGMELLDILARENVDFSTVALGHLDRNPDEYYLLKLADRGIYIQFDGPGKVKYYPDSIRVALIKSLISHGYADQLLISGDMGRASYLEGYGGGPGFRYIKTKFIPRLLDEGVDEDVIHKIFVENPKRWLAVY